MKLAAWMARTLALTLCAGVAAVTASQVLAGESTSGIAAVVPQNGVTPAMPGAAVQLQVRPSVDFPPIGLAEIWPAAVPVVDMGVWRSADNAISRLGVAPVPEVRRATNLLWRLRIHRSLPDPIVDYRITATSGVDGSLSSVSVPTSTLSARTEPIGPVFVGRQGNRRIFEGGVELFLDIGAARSAGAYGGTLTVTFTNL